MLATETEFIHLCWATVIVIISVLVFIYKMFEGGEDDNK